VRYVRQVTPTMTTITTPSLELAPIGNEAAPSTSLFSLVDDMGIRECLQDEAEQTHVKVISPLSRREYSSGKTV
jgi:hypothetical protein